MMNKSNRLMLVKTTLSAMPSHIAICVELPSWVQKIMIKIMNAFLWTGLNNVQGSKCLVVWSRVQRPKQLWGGAGSLGSFAVRSCFTFEVALAAAYRGLQGGRWGMVPPSCSGWTIGLRGRASKR
jgi:hypothetical protein